MDRARPTALIFVVAAAIAACNATPKTGVRPEPTASASATAPPSANASSSAAREPGAEGRLVVMPALDDADALSTIRSERLRAKADGRVLVVYVFATWCEPCKKLKEEIERGRLDARLGKTTLLAFDADKDVDRLRASGYAFKFVPFVALPGPDGRPADAQQATGRGGDAWRELLDKLEGWQRDAQLPR